MLTSPLTGLEIFRFRHTFPWLARHGLNDHATPWLNALRGPAPLIKDRVTGFRVPRAVISTPMPLTPTTSRTWGPPPPPSATLSLREGKTTRGRALAQEVTPGPSVSRRTGENARRGPPSLISGVRWSYPIGPEIGLPWEKENTIFTRLRAYSVFPLRGGGRPLAHFRPLMVSAAGGGHVVGYVGIII
jgi:hypothetical protein